jgi:hypothetical protein
MDKHVITDIPLGSYVLATRWCDGDRRDPWGIGWYLGLHEPLRPNYPITYRVADSDGRPHGGYQLTEYARIKKISKERGEWILSHKKEIEWGDRSLWWWVRYSMKKSLYRDK